MKHSIHRRNFILKGALAAVGACCAGGTGMLHAANPTAPKRAALRFIGAYSDKFRVRSEEGGVTRLVAEVRSVSRFSKTYQRAPRYLITRLYVAGTTTTFQIGKQSFEVENLFPADFAAQNS